MPAPRFSRPLALINGALIMGSFLGFGWQLRHLPAQIPVHFGASGLPDRWGSPHELWFVGAMMLFLSALLAGIGAWIARHSGPMPSHHLQEWRALTEERALRTLRVLELIMLTQNLGLAMLWGILGTGRAELAPVGIVAVLLLSVVGLVAVLAIHGPRLSTIGDELRRLGVFGGAPDGYRWGGLFYYAPDDRAVWVPKRSGLGLTVNFARPQAWLITAAALVIPLIGVAVAIAGARAW